MRFAFLMAAAAALTSCVRTPESYPIPPQHPSVETYVGKADPEAGEFVHAGDPRAERFFVKDVRDLEGSWRWTFPEPEFRFVLNSPAPRSLHAEFGINDRTFRDTGPVTILYIVNGHELARVQYTSFGEQVFEKPVPDGWLKLGAENRVVMKILNPWKAPDAGVYLGVTLRSMGFVGR